MSFQCLYDLQEPFRWLGDVTTMEAFESVMLDMKDFYFLGDDYRYHIEGEAKRRFLELLKNRFNSGVKYRSKTWTWGSVIQVKTMELARFLLWELDQVDFAEPKPSLLRIDNLNLRRKILKLSAAEAKSVGINKSSLHWLRQNVKRNRSFCVHRTTFDRLRKIP